MKKNLETNFIKIRNLLQMQGMLRKICNTTQFLDSLIYFENHIDEAIEWLLKERLNFFKN